MTCPKCAADVPAAATVCTACGVVLAKVARGPRPVRSQPRMLAANALAAHELKLLGGGFAAALIVLAIPFLRGLVQMLATLIHELGHAVVAWLLGHPALPAFDFVYGGGITHHAEFQIGLALLIAIAGLALLWRLRRNRLGLTVIGTIFVLWLVVVVSEPRRQLAISAGGHGFEALFAGVFLFMALADVGWRRPELERPLGAFVGFFLAGNAIAFCWRLRHDAGFLADYREGKGGALMNDLESLALDIRIHTGAAPGIEGVAGWFLVLTVLAVLGAIAAWVWREQVAAGVARVLRVEA